MANQQTLDFIRQHEHDDIKRLAFLGDKHPEVDLPWALDQIRGRQTARTKLPEWARTDGIVYPPHLSMEQCSSEATALYKRQVLERWLAADALAGEKRTLTDLTGGFGVDFSYLAPLFHEATYTERLPHLCEAARHNFQLLGLSHATVKNGDSIDILQQLPRQTAIYVDPARRDAHGRKTYSIKDCTPDVAQLCPQLLDHCQLLLIKLSPMLDWHEAVRELQRVREVHIVSVGNECKELLLVCSACADTPLTVTCVNDDETFQFTPSLKECTPKPQPTNSSLFTPHSSPNKHSSLLIPNSSIMKAGCFEELCHAFDLRAVSPNSHIFVNSDETALFERFPGRIFQIVATSTMNKKELRSALNGITQANIAVRNFPLTADALRKRLKLKDGGDTYIFGTTTLAREHIIIITKKER